MLTLYDYLSSGNGYKVRLALNQLAIPYRRVELDILAGATRTPEFLAKNPNGRIPALATETGGYLAESNAILFYRADGTRVLPTEPLSRARGLQWMFFEQYSHEPYIATSRFLLMHGARNAETRARLADKRPGGLAAFGVMEGHLEDRAYFVEARYTIADIALYAYTHVAEQGDFDLAPYPAIGAWLARVRAEPGHIPITQG